MSWIVRVSLKWSIPNCDDASETDILLLRARCGKRTLPGVHVRKHLSLTGGGGDGEDVRLSLDVVITPGALGKTSFPID